MPCAHAIEPSPSIPSFEMTSSVFSASHAARCVAPARVEHHVQDAVESRTQLYAPALAVVSSSPPLPLSARVDAAGVSLDGVGLLTPGRDVLAAG